ncbi:hypothetical protein GEMRC1_009578 [Eukaryota sp. GEM-RC1]
MPEHPIFPFSSPKKRTSQPSTESDVSASHTVDPNVSSQSVTVPMLSSTSPFTVTLNLHFNQPLTQPISINLNPSCDNHQPLMKYARHSIDEDVHPSPCELKLEEAPCQDWPDSLPFEILPGGVKVPCLRPRSTRSQEKSSVEGVRK